jgi:extracellular solute-binding protein (family 5)
MGPVQTELRFRLRDGVKWHDGRPFTANDVKCTWDTLLGKTGEKFRLNPRKAWYENLEEVASLGNRRAGRGDRRRFLPNSGTGPPLVLLPLELSPGQWEPIIPVLAERWATITLGGAHLGSVASREERGRSGYMGVVRSLLDQMTIRPGKQVVEIGCGSGVIMRELARRARSQSSDRDRPKRLYYLLSEARALARGEG